VADDHDAAGHASFGHCRLHERVDCVKTVRVRIVRARPVLARRRRLRGQRPHAASHQRNRQQENPRAP